MNTARRRISMKRFSIYCRAFGVWLSLVLSTGLPPSMQAAEHAGNALTTSAQAAVDAERIGITADEIRIGSCVPLTGTKNSRGHEVIVGASTYFSQINDRGGINGRKVKLSSFDDCYDPERAIECFNTNLKNKV